MEKIIYHDKEYYYSKDDIIDWWEEGVPMIISCVSDDKAYMIYFNEYGDIDIIREKCK